MTTTKPLCVIPARKGSKRLPKKNLLTYRGKPLVQIAVEKAIESEIFESVILNTDDLEIIQLFHNNSDLDISIRPDFLTGDQVRADEVIRWEITSRALGADVIICCILPTTPSLDMDQISLALQYIPKNSPIFGVTKSREHVYRTFTLGTEKSLKPLFPKELSLQSQDYPETYSDAGSFYLAAAHVWLDNFSITASKDSRGWVLDANKNIDINNIDDWNLFKALNPE